MSVILSHERIVTTRLQAGGCRAAGPAASGPASFGKKGAPTVLRKLAFSWLAAAARHSSNSQNGRFTA
jgi:hypothetical protein